ncbi:peptide ABC transporter ATP-binding protein [Streptomyces azureus]|uniref:Peptide ABC transporter ATP-binding protein n=1 Tax=Streptomyces azureus TaxID=146537 RepID=A0A0K8PX54_STRAJ|nr:peptide ABC transporter ATP-binding protein [Streptomyces azureus]
MPAAFAAEVAEDPEGAVRGDLSGPAGGSVVGDAEIVVVRGPAEREAFTGRESDLAAVSLVLRGRRRYHDDAVQGALPVPDSCHRQVRATHQGRAPSYG